MRFQQKHQEDALCAVFADVPGCGGCDGEVDETYQYEKAVVGGCVNYLLVDATRPPYDAKLSTATRQSPCEPAVRRGALLSFARYQKVAVFIVGLTLFLDLGLMTTLGKS